MDKIIFAVFIPNCKRPLAQLWLQVSAQIYPTYQSMWD